MQIPGRLEHYCSHASAASSGLWQFVVIPSALASAAAHSLTATTERVVMPLKFKKPCT